MKKLIFILLSVILVAGLIAGCSSSSAAGPTILKVSGKITEKNAGDVYNFDEAAFSKNATVAEYKDPWVGDGTGIQKYKGITLAKFIELVKPASDATTISVVATDGKALDIPISDAQKWNIMLVHWNGDTVLDQKTGGPVKIAFPEDASGTYPNDQWMWWLTEVKVK